MARTQSWFVGPQTRMVFDVLLHGLRGFMRYLMMVYAKRDMLYHFLLWSVAIDVNYHNHRNQDAFAGAI